MLNVNFIKLSLYVITSLFLKAKAAILILKKINNALFRCNILNMSSITN